MSENKHRWSLEEDKYCCEICVKYYVTEKANMPVEDLVRDLTTHFSDIPANSLRMKIQNIKQLFEEGGIDNTLRTKPLANYSRQNKKAMDEALRHLS